MNTELGDRLKSLAGQLSYANGVKDAAKIRSQCTLDEWQVVLKEAKEIYNLRLAVRPKI